MAVVIDTSCSLICSANQWSWSRWHRSWCASGFGPWRSSQSDSCCPSGRRPARCRETTIRLVKENARRDTEAQWVLRGP